MLHTLYHCMNFHLGSGHIIIYLNTKFPFEYSWFTIHSQILKHLFQLYLFLYQTFYQDIGEFSKVNGYVDRSGSQINIWNIFVYILSIREQKRREFILLSLQSENFWTLMTVKIAPTLTVYKYNTPRKLIGRKIDLQNAYVWIKTGEDDPSMTCWPHDHPQYDINILVSVTEIGFLNLSILQFRSRLFLYKNYKSNWTNWFLPHKIK